MHRIGPFGVLFLLCAACCFAPPTPAGGAPSVAPGGSAGVAPSIPGVPAPPPPPAIEVTACEVQDAYADNEIGGANRFPSGTHMIVSGRVDRVAQTFGTMIIHPRVCIFAMVNLADDQAAAAGLLHPGDSFRADCVMGNYVMAASFDDCRLLP